MGELWVTYDVELIHEKISDLADDSMAIYDSIAPTSGFASMSAFTKIKGEDISMSSGILNLQSVVPGYYSLHIQLVPDNGATLTRSGNTVTFTKNCVANNIIFVNYTGATTTLQALGGAAANAMVDYLITF